jgi:hypothetical protein
MKVFGITLLDWEQHAFGWNNNPDKAWYRTTPNYFPDRMRTNSETVGCLRLYHCADGKWLFNYFGRIFNFLDSIYSGPEKFDTAEKAKTYIDEWLMQIDKLKAFW